MYRGAWITAPHNPRLGLSTHCKFPAEKITQSRRRAANPGVPGGPPGPLAAPLLSRRLTTPTHFPLYLHAMPWKWRYHCNINRDII